ncbi:MAG TPA: ABC transporter permease [Bacteroidetes bacterium]|nr:ABC transporter permease [Bacteroidota bacterium]
MNLPFKIAKRYLLGKKSINAINIITGISVLGIAIGAMALILILSVFNGFEDLIKSNFNAFNPELKITPKKGKFFEVDSAFIQKLSQIKDIDSYSLVQEEVAYFEYDNSRSVGVIKGVDDNFKKVNNIDTTIIAGEFNLSDKNIVTGVLGSGLANKLGVSVSDQLTPLTIYILKQKSGGGFNTFYKKAEIMPVGKFALQSESDMKYVIIPLELSKYLLDNNESYSAIEIKTKAQSVKRVEQELKELFGDNYNVKNRMEQDAELMKIMNMEKWISYAIVSLTLLLVAFNMIGSLWMIVLDKRRDISILQSMGADKKTVKKIFYYEGMLISGIGLIIGTLLALIFYYIQKHYGIIGIPQGFVIDAYPIQLRIPDFLIVSVTVFIIGILISILPAYRAGKIPAFLREE